MNRKPTIRYQSHHGRTVAVALLLAVALGLLCVIWLGCCAGPSSNKAVEQTDVLATNALGDKPADRPLPQASQSSSQTAEKTLTISLVGDINFADGWGADFAFEQGNSVAAAFSPEILSLLQNSDITYANHEFTLSSGGERLAKTYTFQASPDRVDYWKQLGVNVVGLANNHAYDYGQTAFLENLEILKANGIQHVGAGLNLEEATRAARFEVNGYSVALVAADRSQKGAEVRAQAATENAPGVLFCFDDQQFLEAVRVASTSADFVIAIPHWGTEGSTVLEAEQIALAEKLIDSGASAVIGSHPHVLQGLDFYHGKPIAYSLGNFWFNWETALTMVFTIQIVHGQSSFKIVPAVQTEQQVLANAAISSEVIALMRELSPNVTIDDEGRITATE